MPESLLRKMRTVQRLLPVRFQAAAGLILIQVHGHRGARAIMPENTIAGFEYAIGVGVDAIEMDEVVSRDDVVIVSHDPYLKSGTFIRTLKAAETGLATLHEVLALDGTFLFNIEAKVSEHTPP